MSVRTADDTPSARDPAGDSAPATRRRDGQILIFFAAAFVGAWLCWIPTVVFAMPSGFAVFLRTVGAFAPSVAAVVLASVVGGRNGVRGLLVSLMRWRTPARWYAVTLAGPFVVVLAAIALDRLAGGSVGAFNDPAQWYVGVLVFVYVLVLGGPLGEEIGWRGFALVRLQTRFGPVPASLLLGVIWGGWHLPLFFSDGTVQQQIPMLLFVAQTTATSVVYTWVVNRTHSVLHAVLLHAAANTAVGLFPVLPSDTGSLRPLALAVALASAVAVVLVVATRGRLGLSGRTHDERSSATRAARVSAAEHLTEAALGHDPRDVRLRLPGGSS